MSDTSTQINPGTAQAEKKGWNWGAFLLGFLLGVIVVLVVVAYIAISVFF